MNSFYERNHHPAATTAATTTVTVTRGKVWPWKGPFAEKGKYIFQNSKWRQEYATYRINKIWRK